MIFKYLVLGLCFSSVLLSCGWLCFDFLCFWQWKLLANSRLLLFKEITVKFMHFFNLNIVNFLTTESESVKFLYECGCWKTHRNFTSRKSIEKFTSDTNSLPISRDILCSVLLLKYSQPLDNWVWFGKRFYTNVRILGTHNQ